MTSFGRSQTKNDWGMAVWELRSINHRYLDISIRLPELVRELEQPIRESIQKFFHRGKIECSLRFYPGEKLNATIAVNRSLLEQLIKVSTQVSELLPEKITYLNLADILAWNGVIVEESVDISAVKGDLIALFTEAASDLRASRKREGLQLAKTIEHRASAILEQVGTIKSHLPMVLEKQRTKLLMRLDEAMVSLDTGRLEQEMVYFAQKMDVSEELDRTIAHITEVNRTLAEDEAAGRRLDFLMQELNREANTLASKSVDPLITHAAVEMKVLIEQIREQVQNIE